MATITTTIRYATNLAELTRNMQQGRDQIETTTASANRMVAALGGTNLIRAAHNAVAAIEQVGGVTKLTTQEQERLLTTLDKSIAKMERMGQVVPTAMRATADELRAATAAAEKKVTTWERVDGALGKVGLSIKGLGLAGLATGLVSFGRQAIAAAGQIVDLSDKTKLSTTAVQQYGYMARQTGGEVTQWADAVFKGGVKIEQGSKTTRDAVAGLGLQYDQLRALKPEAQFDTIMRSLAAIEGPQERNRLGVELLGKGYSNVAAAVDDYVKMMGEAPVAGEAAVRATDKAADAIGRLWDGLKNTAINAIGGVILAAENADKKLDELRKKAAPAAYYSQASSADYNTMNALTGDAMMLPSVMPQRRDIALPFENVTKTIEDVRTFTQRAQDAQREVANLSSATRAQIDAGLKLGESIESLGEKFDLSADAQRLYTTAAKASTTAQSEAAKSAERHAEAAANVNAQLADLTPLQLMQVQALLAAGNAERDIAEALRMTERHVQLVSQAEKNRADAAKDQLAQIKLAEEQRQAFLGTAQKLEDQIMKGEIDRLNARNQLTVKNLLATRDLEQQVRDLNATRSLSAHEQQVYQIQTWAAEQKAAFTGSAEEIKKYHALIDQLAALKMPLFSPSTIKLMENANTALGVTKGLVDDIGHSMTGTGRIITSAISSAIGLVQNYIVSLKSAETAAHATAAASAVMWGAATLGISVGITAFMSWRAHAKAFKAEVASLGDSIRKLGGTPLPQEFRDIDGVLRKYSRSQYLDVLKTQLAELEAQAEAAAEWARRLQDGIADLRGAVEDFGGRAPAELHPYINELLRMNGLTAEQQLLLSDLIDEPGWREMEAAAGRLGVALSSLGPAFAQAKLSEQALQTVRDLKFLEQGGADMNAVLRDSSGHIQSLVRTAMDTGAALPNTLKPYIQKLIDMELLTDPSGELVRNIDQLSFKDIEDDALSAIKGLLEQIRDLLQNQIPNAARTANAALNSVDVPEPASSPNPQYNEDGSPRAHRGAMVTAQGVRRFHSGFPRLASDEFPAILQSGEAVLNRSATATLGYSRIAGLNRGQMQGGGGGVVVSFAPGAIVVNGVQDGDQAAEELLRRLPAALERIGALA